MSIKASWEVMAYPDFRNQILSRFLGNFAIQMQMLTLSWWVWQLTRSPLALGFIGLAEILPFAAFSFWGGRAADEQDKRRMIIQGQSGLLLLTLTLVFLSAFAQYPLPGIYVVLALLGFVRSFLWSATHAYSQMAVPSAVYGRAAAWNSSAWEMSTVLGPSCAGVLYTYWGSTGVLKLGAALMAVAVCFSMRLSPKPPLASVAQEARPDLLSGMRFVFSRQPLWGALTLDMFAVLFGGVVALLPVFADRLGVGSVGLGWLRASPALGAITMALYQTTRGPYTQPGRMLLLAVSVFGLLTIAFAFSHTFWLSVGLLMLSGMADNVSVVIRHSLVQAFTPDAWRGRVSAINGIFIGCSNELGTFESGVAAHFLGLVPSVVAGGLLTLATVAFIVWKAPDLRRLRWLQDYQR